jgi:hypothetical protein
MGSKKSQVVRNGVVAVITVYRDGTVRVRRVREMRYGKGKYGGGRYG